MATTTSRVRARLAAGGPWWFWPTLVGACLLGGYGIASTGMIRMLALPIYVVLAVVVTSVFLDWVAMALVAAIMFVPIYWVSLPAQLHVALTAVVAAGFLLPVPALLRGHRVKLNALDGLFALYASVTILSLFANFEDAELLAWRMTATVVLPYVAFRLLFTSDRLLRRVSLVVVAMAGVLSVLALGERASGINPFQQWRTPGYLAQLWAVPVTRFGELRPSASFGQPLVFATCLAAVMVALMPFAFTGSRRRRLLAGATEALLLAGLLATASRGPVLMLVSGFLLFLAGRQRRRLRPLLLTGSLLILAYVFTPLGDAVQKLLISFTDDSRDSQTVGYRFSLFQLLGDSGRFTWMGRPGSYYDLNSTALRSIDSEYVLVYLHSGLLTLVAFVALLVPVLLVALRHPDPLRRAWAGAVAVTFQGVATVALLLQQADIFWIGMACVASSFATTRKKVATSEDGSVVDDFVVDRGRVRTR